MKVIGGWMVFGMIFISFFLFACDGEDSSDDDDDTLAGDDDASDDDLANDDNAVDDDNDDDSHTDDDGTDDDEDDDTGIDDDIASDDDDEYLAPPPSDEIGVFVSAAVGDDTNPGTMAAPVKTVTKGVQLAEGAEKVVFVAEGVYAEGFRSAASRFGGYRQPDRQRDPDVYVTSILSPDGLHVTLTGGAAKDPRILEGFTITGGKVNALGYYAYDFTAGVEVDSGAAIIAHNHITGSPATASGFLATVESAGIYVHNAHGVRIHGNVVASNQTVSYYYGESFSYGILVCTDQGIETQVEENHIYTLEYTGPQFNRGPATGIEVRAGSTLLVGNHLSIGPMVSQNSSAINVSDAGSLTAINNLLVIKPTNNHTQVVAATGPTALIDNTLINQSIEDAQGVMMGDTEVVLINNIFYLGPSKAASAIFFTLYGLPQIVLMNNDLFCNAITKNLVNAWDWTIEGTNELNQCQWEGCQEASANMAVEPGFISSTDAHLAAISPCIDTGVDPSPWYAGPEINLDFDGNARPQGAGWEMGFDEYMEE